jgi:hypothetical protein
MSAVATQCRHCGTFIGKEHRCPPRELPVARVAASEPTVFTEPEVTRRPRILGDPERDMELLAKHLPTLVGSALDPEPKVASGRVLNGRADHVDQNHGQLDDAIRVLRRLATIEWQQRLALVYMYLVVGPEARARFQSFDTRIGLVFATPTQRMAWLTTPTKNMGMGAASRHGQTRRVAAVQAYAAVAEDPPITDGQWLSQAIDATTRMDSVAASDIRTLNRVREQNRCAKPPGVPRNRRERRATAKTGQAAKSRS